MAMTGVCGDKEQRARYLGSKLSRTGDRSKPHNPQVDWRSYNNGCTRRGQVIPVEIKRYPNIFLSCARAVEPKR